MLVMTIHEHMHNFHLHKTREFFILLLQYLNLSYVKRFRKTILLHLLLMAVWLKLYAQYTDKHVTSDLYQSRNSLINTAANNVLLTHLFRMTNRFFGTISYPFKDIHLKYSNIKWLHSYSLQTSIKLSGSHSNAIFC